MGGGGQIFCDVLLSILIGTFGQLGPKNQYIFKKLVQLGNFHRIDLLLCGESNVCGATSIAESCVAQLYKVWRLYSALQ